MAESLATYGTLAPGESNHWVVSRIDGEWLEGTVTGYVFEITWGPAEGYLGFLPTPDGIEVAVAVLRSGVLSKRWREIDDFEGAGYERQHVEVTLTSGDVITAWIYVALTDT